MSCNQNRIRLVAGIVLFLGFPSFGSGSSVLHIGCERLREAASHGDPNFEFDLLRDRLSHADQTVKSLSVTADIVTGIDHSVMGTESMTAWAVVKVETTSGPKVIKFVQRDLDEHDLNHTSDPDFMSRDQAILQHQLGEGDDAVPVTGILGKYEVERLLEKFPQLYQFRQAYSGNPGWAYVMDYVPEAWNPKPKGFDSARQQPAPPEAINWDLVAIKQKLSDIKAKLKQMKVKPGDFQLLFDSHGIPRLIDVERFAVLDRGRQGIDEAARGGEPIGKTLDREFDQYFEYVSKLILKRKNDHELSKAGARLRKERAQGDGLDVKKAVEAFGPAFISDVDSLAHESHVLVTGNNSLLPELAEGRQVEGHEVEARSRGLTSLTLGPSSSKALNAMARQQDRQFRSLNGKYLEDYSPREIGQCDLIVDDGPFRHTARIDQVLRKYLEVLKVGGKLYLHADINQIHIDSWRYDPNSSMPYGYVDIGLIGYLNQIPGIKVTLINDHSVRIEKVGETDLSHLKTLELWEYRDGANAFRSYRISG